MNAILPLHRLPLYNTGRLDDSEIKELFSARIKVFDRIMEDTAAEREKSRAQHHLLVGQRGMGKTMLLARIAAEIRTEERFKHLIPLVFAEEQYAVDRLSKFWLNCLDSLADAQERLGNQENAAKIDYTVKELGKDLLDASKNDEMLAGEALKAFLEAAASIKKRPLLLVDNLQLVFERITNEQQHALREILMRPGSPILIGTSPSPPPESQDYGAPFYDHFKVHYLRPLDVVEMRELMVHLAEISELPEVRERILTHPRRLDVLRQLTGGNLRTTAILFFLYSEDFAPNTFGDLENLLDRVTPLYKARFEELSPQQQVISSAIANHWDPVTSRALSELTGIPMSGISAQIDRLEKSGFIERVELFGKSSKGFQIAERFFNIWFLMRSASRRQRREVEFLTRFIENFYESRDRDRIARQLLTEQNLSPDRHLFAKALCSCLDDKLFTTDLERHIHLDALRQSRKEKARAIQKLSEILDLSALPEATLAFSDLEKRLISLTPSDSEITAEEFVENILGSRLMFVTGMPQRLASRSDSFTNEEASLLLKDLEDFSEIDRRRYGEKATAWLQKRLATGQIRSVRDVEDWERAIQMAKDAPSATILLDSMPSNLFPELSMESRDKSLQILAPSNESQAEDWLAYGFRLQKQLGQYDEAEKAYRRAIELAPTSAIPWNELGNLLKEHFDRFSDAEDAYRESIKLDASFAMPWRNLGTLLADQLDRFEEAETCYRKAIEVDSAYAIPWHELGRLLHFRFKRFDEAEAAYRKAIELDPDFPLPWRNLGSLLEYLRRYREAEKSFEKAIELNPFFFWAWIDLGDLARDHFDDLERAEMAYRRAINCDTDRPEGFRRLGSLLANHLGRHEEALDVYQVVARLEPENSGVLNTIGNLYCDYLGHPRDAETAFERSLEIDPGSECAFQNLVFVRRDFMGQGSNVRAFASQFPQPVSIEFQDTLHLQESLFDAYESNWGLAVESLEHALKQASNGFSSNTKDDWMRSSAVLIHLNYGQKLLNFLEDRGYAEQLRPWYEALSALIVGDRRKLLNTAPEIRITAEEFYDEIEIRLRLLPESTGRRRIPERRRKRKASDKN